ncbi:MAG: gene transfer agent family protein [Stutzerimonas stutzeri]|nr:MAG: gene transfer agent family protein [Stutzerimonas stutzeri]
MSGPNRRAEVELDFADGRYLFALKIAHLGELQDKCRAGLGEIATRLFSGTPRYEDIYETLRLGLIGGGLAPVPAREVIERYILPLAAPGDPASPLMTAQAVIGAAWFGLDEIKAPGPGKEKAPTSGSTSEPSMVSASASDSRRKKSARSRSGK